MKNNRIFKTGMFYLLLIVLSLTVAILANLVMAALPARITQQNMNEAGILELSSETNVFLGAMQQDATVYWKYVSFQLSEPVLLCVKRAFSYTD